MRVRKKTVEVNAIKYDGDLKGTNGKFYVSLWCVIACHNGTLYYKDGDELYIKTLEGDHHVSVGDYIIRGV